MRSDNCLTVLRHLHIVHNSRNFVRTAAITNLKQVLRDVEEDGDGFHPLRALAVVEQEDPEDDGDEDGARVGAGGQPPAQFQR